MARCEPPRQKSQLENQQATSQFTARLVPLCLIGVVGFTTWVVIVSLCIDYLIHDDNDRSPTPRPGAGIAIIVIYFVLLIPMAISYFRLLSTVPRPGYIDKGTPTDATPVKQEKVPERNVRHGCTNTKVKEEDHEPGTINEGEQVRTLDIERIFSGETPPPPGTERFYSKDVFVCDPNGLPIWCGMCCNWKPDRVHHNSDTGRCVYKLDHFCPWVGGVVGERNFNFFIQFNFYTALFTLFVLIVMAFFIANYKSTGETVSNSWYAVLALSAVFTLFTGGMMSNSIHLASKNLSTIDSIGHQHRTMYLAVLINDPATNTTDRPRPSSNTDLWQGTITYPLYVDRPAPSNFSDSASSATPKPLPPSRTFAVLRTQPGMHPWDLGKYRNLKSIMGERWYDWFLPLRHSPCCNHDRGDSMYELGPDVERLKIDAGLLPPVGESPHKLRKLKRSHRTQEDDPEELNIMGPTPADVNGVTGGGSASRRDSDGVSVAT